MIYRSLIWLTTLTIANPIEAPPLPAWQGDLPAAERVDSGTFLPAPLDQEVQKRLMFLDHYPQLCQQAIDCADSLARLEAVDPPTWPWQLAVGLGIITGAVVGYQIGAH